MCNMIYLDANAIYWYYGRDMLHLPLSDPNLDVNKLCNYLDIRTDLSLPASVLMEIVVHFRDYPDDIKNILSFIKDKNIKVLNNLPNHCFTSDELTILQLCASRDTLKKYAYKLLDVKIEIEIRHAYVFLQTISLLYADYYLKSISSLTDDIRGNVLHYLGNDFLNEMKEDHTSQLTKSLKDGYADNNKSQQYLKKKYMELLVQNCVIFQMIIDTVTKFLENEQDLYTVMCNSAQKARNSGFDEDHIMRIVVDALATDSTFLQEAKTRIPDIFREKGYTKHQAKYIKTLLSAWLERGQKLKKNDIFDMLYVGSVDKQVVNRKKSIIFDQNSYLLSFDSAVLSFICEDEWNKHLLNKFLLSNR